jgi:hypothetical protein
MLTCIYSRFDRSIDVGVSVSVGPLPEVSSISRAMRGVRAHVNDAQRHYFLVQCTYPNPTMPSTVRSRHKMDQNIEF